MVFMGTPDFAVPSLRILLDNGFDVAGVVTATDKWGGRGKQQLLQSAVKRFAVERGLPVLQPEKLKDPQFLEQLAALDANLQVIVAFRMLPEAVWRMPALGAFNLHGSLLPRYRGAAPINWAVINGDTETGVTTFFLNSEIDTGDLLFQERMTIGPDDTAGDVHDRMMELGAQTVLKTVQAIENQSYTLQKQDEGQASKAPKIFHETCQINFRQSAAEVHNFIRGLSPYPAAWTMLEGEELKILRSSPATGTPPVAPGMFFTDQKSWLRYATNDGWVEVLELQLQGRRRMSIADFMKGYRFR
ncbi:MAG TPA: methionyl-tRNA formyltransferase [Saprospiraceae bacterium]|nr:methionyl-tRNA formyltransferase [Saprospiraceae bacterium]